MVAKMFSTLSLIVQMVSYFTDITMELRSHRPQSSKRSSGKHNNYLYLHAVIITPVWCVSDLK